MSSKHSRTFQTLSCHEGEYAARPKYACLIALMLAYSNLVGRQYRGKETDFANQNLKAINFTVILKKVYFDRIFRSALKVIL